MVPEVHSKSFDGLDPDDDDEFYHDVEQFTKAYKAVHGYGLMARSDGLLMAAHLDYIERFAHLANVSTGLCASDSGADSWILSQQWEIIHTYNKKASVIGFDHTAARKDNLEVVDALAYVVAADGGYEGIVRVNHGIHNPTAHITLASEFQTRNHEWIVDPTHRKHVGVDGQPGTQSMVSPDRQHTIPLRCVSSLMTFCVRRLTPTELQDYQDGNVSALEFTAEGDWFPAHYTDSPGQALRAAYLGRTDVDDDDDSLGSIGSVPSLAAPVLDTDGESVSVDVYPSDDDASTVFHSAVADNSSYYGYAPWEMHPDDPHLEEDTLSFSTVYGDPIPHPDVAVAALRARSTQDDPPDEVVLARTFDNPADDDPIHQIGDNPTLAWNFAAIASGDTPTFEGAYVEETTGSNDPVQAFLSSRPDDELFGRGEHFDSFAFAVESSIKAIREAEDMQPYLNWAPVDVIRKTLENTTQMAKIIWRYPLRKHIRSRFPLLRLRWLEETVSTDTTSSPIEDINGRRFVQVFYGVVSRMINVYPMFREKDFLGTLQDFLRHEGVMRTLRRDQAQAKRSKKVTSAMSGPKPTISSRTRSN